MDMIREAAHIARSEHAAAVEVLSFRLGTEHYGVDIQRVREIRSYEVPTRIARLPAHVKGVINLRGSIVPIIDLRLKLGCERCEHDAHTAVVVLDLNGRIVGAVVDEVDDVLELAREQIGAAPWLAAESDTAHVAGIGRVGERTLVLLDIDALLAGDGSAGAAGG